MTGSNKRELAPDTVVDFIASIFEQRGAEEYLGEPVTIGTHMLQSAALAEKAGLAEPVIVAALLHDIGHFTGSFGTFSMDDTADRHHEETGAELLAPFFPAIVTDCVRYHVAAKRYLCATKPEYFARLSEASVHSLKLQGGPMNSTEIAEFEKNPNLEAIVQVRHLDEAGKQSDMATPPFSHFAPMVQRVIDAHCGTADR